MGGLIYRLIATVSVIFVALRTHKSVDGQIQVKVNLIILVNDF
jgi:hypothetical protein